MDRSIILVVPQEILIRIFTVRVQALSRSARNATLANFALVSRQFASASFEVLYSDLQIDWFAGRAILLTRTLASDPQLAKRIRAFAARGVAYEDRAFSHAQLVLSDPGDASKIIAEARERAQAGERAPQLGFLVDVASAELDVLDEPARDIAIYILDERYCQTAWIDEGHDDWSEAPPTGEEPVWALFYVLGILPALRELNLSGMNIWARRIAVPPEVVHKLRRLTSLHTRAFDDCLLSFFLDLGRAKTLTFHFRESPLDITSYPSVRLPSLVELTIHSRVARFPTMLAHWLAGVAPPTLRKLTISEVRREYLKHWAGSLQNLPELDHLHLEVLTDSRYGAYPNEFLSWLSSSHVRILHLVLDPSPALMLSIPDTVVHLAVRPDHFLSALILFGSRQTPIRNWIYSHPHLEAFDIICSRHNLSITEREGLFGDIGPTFAEANVRLSAVEVQDEWSYEWRCHGGCSFGCEPSRVVRVSSGSDSDGSSTEGSGSD